MQPTRSIFYNLKEICSPYQERGVLPLLHTIPWLGSRAAHSGQHQEVSRGRPWLPLSPHEETAPHHRHSSGSHLSNPRWPCIFLNYKRHKQANWICFQVWSAGVSSCPNEKCRTPKDAFLPTQYFLGDSGNWGDGISFWNNMFLCCFEHTSGHTTASRSGPTHVSFQKAPKLLLPKWFFFFAVMQMEFTFHHCQTANLKFISFSITEFITKTGCGYV